MRAIQPEHLVPKSPFLYGITNFCKPATAIKDELMPNSSEANIATADALTLLLHNQHALGAAIEEVTKWLSDNGVGSVAANALATMETLDTNAQALTAAINRLRLSN